MCDGNIPAFELVMKVRGHNLHLECFKCQECSHRSVSCLLLPEGLVVTFCFSFLPTTSASVWGTSSISTTTRESCVSTTTRRGWCSRLCPRTHWSRSSARLTTSWTRDLAAGVPATPQPLLGMPHMLSHRLPSTGERIPLVFGIKIQTNNKKVIPGSDNESSS